MTDACPDCGSTDVSYFRENDAPYYCWECGIRFRSPAHPADEQPND